MDVKIFNKRTGARSHLFFFNCNAVRCPQCHHEVTPIGTATMITRGFKLVLPFIWICGGCDILLERNFGESDVKNTINTAIKHEHAQD
jgi:hypothetical protein